MIALRASPIPVASGILTKRLAALQSASGNRPIDNPPAEAAPAQAASIAPPLPPHKRVRPSVARPAPSAKAASRSTAFASPGPITAIGGRHGAPLSVCSH